jgi:uncharacterized protein YraI
MRNVLLALVLIVFSSPAYAGACLNKNTSPIEKITKASSFKVSDVNLRAGAGLKYCKLREVSNAKNKPVTIKGKSGSWSQITFDGKDYWVHGSLLNSNVNQSTHDQKGAAAYKRGDYATAAEQGNARAQSILGAMYQYGNGVPQNYKTAVKWNRLSAEQGNIYAMTNLGVMYDNGLGVPQDYVRAYMWFNIATSSRENKKATKNRGIVAKRMTPSQIAEAQKLARECVRKKYRGC